MSHRPQEHRVRIIDTPMGPGRATLRLALTLTEDDEPDELLVCAGFGTGGGFHRPTWGSSMVSIPGDIVADVLAALTSLVEASG